MTLTRIDNCGGLRIHAIVLTRDRPETLARCVRMALAAMTADDALTVLDDTPGPQAQRNALILKKAATGSPAPVRYLRAADVQRFVVRVSKQEHLHWQLRTAPRDIAPLRNLELLLSASCDAHTTVLIDDDICSFDLNATHEFLDLNRAESRGIAVGAKIRGTTEYDILTRLSDAMRLLAQADLCDSPPDSAALFQMPSEVKAGLNHCRWLSGGYLAFSLPREELFAFPPGYNEDWLWCLLHGALGTARLVVADQTVIHRPPELRRSTREDILFELHGDLAFDSLCRTCSTSFTSVHSVFTSLREQSLLPDELPVFRVEQMLQQSLALSGNGHGSALRILEDHGLSVLREMLRSGELDFAGDDALVAWSFDAVRKHDSFASTLSNPSVRDALLNMETEGET